MLLESLGYLQGARAMVQEDKNACGFGEFQGRRRSLGNGIATPRIEQFTFSFNKGIFPRKIIFVSGGLKSLYSPSTKAFFPKHMKGEYKK